METENGDQGRLVVGEIEEGGADGVFRGGDGGVPPGGVAAAGGGGFRRRRALFVDPELHLRRMCWSEGAFEEIRVQELAYGYSCCLHRQISNRHVYVCSLCFFFFF